MNGVAGPLLKTYYAIIPITGVLWILSVPLYFGVAVVAEEVVSLMLGLAIAATFLKNPYRERAGALEIALGALAIATSMDNSGHHHHEPPFPTQPRWVAGHHTSGSKPVLRTR